MTRLPDPQNSQVGLPPSGEASTDADTLPQTADDLDRARELSRQGTVPPATVPGYRIMQCLGAGAYGSVWLAQERNTGKRVAIKFYTHRRGLDWSLLNREVEKLAVLYTSRNIVRLLDVGWDSDPPFYVMEYLEHGSLADRLRAGPLPPHEAVRMARGVLQALVHAHGSGILHCDLKPANVLLDPDFEPRICDFGQSRLSHEQNPALGTLFYMAPEQADLQAVPDARWDVYALGALLYHMLHGEPPYRTPENEAEIRSADTLEDRLAVYRRIVRDTPQPDGHRKRRGIDRRLAEIVDRCLEVDPQDRFPNAQAVLDALEQRTRQRARRPLLALGLVGPAILLGLVTFIARNAMTDAVDRSRATQMTQVLESDVLSADIVSRNVQFDLADRRAELMRIARDPEIRRATERAAELPWPERRSHFAKLERLKQQDNAARRRLGRPTDTSWFVTDRNGVQRWRSPYSAESMDQSYHWREYFNGIRQFEEGTPADLEPITEPHISLPFISQSTGRYMVAISVPVLSVDDESEVVGVLARTAHLGALLEEYGKGIRTKSAPADRSAGRDRILALMAPSRRNDPDGTWILLDHPWLKQRETVEHLKGLDRNALRQLLTFPKPQGFVELGNPGRVSRSYRDPVSRIDPESGYHGEWLAAAMPVKDTGWQVIVQERKAAALKPVDDMERALIGHGVWAFSAFVAVMAVMWFFVWRAVTDGDLRSRTRSR